MIEQVNTRSEAVALFQEANFCGSNDAEIIFEQVLHKVDDVLTNEEPSLEGVQKLQNIIWSHALGNKPAYEETANFLVLFFIKWILFGDADIEDAN